MSEEKSYSWLNVAFALCVLVAVCLYAAESEISLGKFADEDTLAEFTIAKSGDFIFFPVRFKDKEYSFVLDTACSHTVFDTLFKSELGDAKRIEKVLTAEAPMMVELFDAPEAFIGPFSLHDFGDVVCLDLKKISSAIGRNVDGVIGINFLKKFVIQIDFDEGRLLLLKPIMGKNPNWGEALQIEYHPLGQPFITGTILNGIKVDFVIDTGMNATGTLHRVIFKEVVLKENLKTSEILGEAASGTVRSRLARVGNLSIGSLQYNELIFGEGNFSSLGLTFLSRHIVTFDFPNNRIYLRKGKEFSKIYEADMSGLHLLRIANKTIVRSVDRDSPAHKAGIRADDIILKVNNKDANEYDIRELRQLLKSKDKYKIMVTIKSSDDVKDVSFILKKKI